MSVMPMLAYADAPAAIDFLTQVFGFTERYRLDMPDGSIGHAELELNGAVIALATAWPNMGIVPPNELNGVHCQILVPLTDVNAHFEHAKAHGATITAAPEDQFHGHRMYRAQDPEGHRWVFQEKLRDVSVDEMKALLKG